MSDTVYAFPRSGDQSWHRQEGMLLRDYFAGQVLAGVAFDKTLSPDDDDLVAKRCYEIADAMLKARDNRVEATV